jgi:hypothetical protein
MNAHLTASLGKNGDVEKVEINYLRDPVPQYLGYGAMYDKNLASSAGIGIAAATH